MPEYLPPFEHGYTVDLSATGAQFISNAAGQQQMFRKGHHRLQITIQLPGAVLHAFGEVVRTTLNGFAVQFEGEPQIVSEAAALDPDLVETAAAAIASKKALDKITEVVV
jgi:hypothetical protein